MIARKTLFVALVAVLAAPGSSCMPDYTFETCGDGQSPAVCIVAPASGSTVTEYIDSPGHSLNVNLIFANVTLRAPGSCMGLQNCGHVHITVTAEPIGGGAPVSCNVMGHPYNAAGTTSTIPIDLDKCLPAGRVLGPHRVTAELFDDGHVALPAQTSTFVDIIAQQ